MAFFAQTGGFEKEPIFVCAFVATAKDNEIMTNPILLFMSII